MNVVFRGSVVGAARLRSPDVRSSRACRRPRRDRRGEGEELPARLEDSTSEAAPTYLADWRPVHGERGSDVGRRNRNTRAAVHRRNDGRVQTVVQARVDLPDVDFPSTRYFWTVVPVAFQTNPT